MPLVILDKLELAYGHWPLLDQAVLVIDKGERIGLIGRNGAGKTSLLSAGLDKPDAGEVWRSPVLRIGHVAQEPAFEPGIWCSRRSPRGWVRRAVCSLLITRQPTRSLKTRPLGVWRNSTVLATNWKPRMPGGSTPASRR